MLLSCIENLTLATADTSSAMCYTSGMLKLRWMFVSLVGFWAVACTPSITSNAVDHFTGTIRRMLIVPTAEPDLDKPGQILDGLMPVVSSIIRDLAHCGIRAEVKVLDRVDASAVAGYISSVPADKAYDAVMRLRPAGRILARGAVMDESFEAVVTEAPSGRALFRARFGGDDLISRDAMSATLIKQLARDGILSSCRGVFTMARSQDFG